MARRQPSRRVARQQRLAAPDGQHPTPRERSRKPRRVTPQMRRPVQPRSAEGHLFRNPHQPILPDMRVNRCTPRLFACIGRAWQTLRAGRDGISNPREISSICHNLNTTFSDLY
jgi:hypothetical protein